MVSCSVRHWRRLRAASRQACRDPAVRAPDARCDRPPTLATVHRPARLVRGRVRRRGCGCATAIWSVAQCALAAGLAWQLADVAARARPAVLRLRRRGGLPRRTRPRSGCGGSASWPSASRSASPSATCWSTRSAPGAWQISLVVGGRPAARARARRRAAARRAVRPAGGVRRRAAAHAGQRAGPLGGRAARRRDRPARRRAAAGRPVAHRAPRRRALAQRAGAGRPLLRRRRCAPRPRGGRRGPGDAPRATQAGLDAWSEALTAGREITRLSPLRRDRGGTGPAQTLLHRGVDRATATCGCSSGGCCSRSRPASRWRRGSPTSSSGSATPSTRSAGASRTARRRSCCASAAELDPEARCTARGLSGSVVLAAAALRRRRPARRHRAVVERARAALPAAHLDTPD